MSGPRTPVFIVVITVLFFIPSSTSTINTIENVPNLSTQTPELETTKRFEIYDGIHVNIPKAANSTGKLVSFEVETRRSFGEGRGSQKKLMQRILPMFIMPFLIQSTIVPLFLSMLKFMLFKSMMIGKLALTLIVLNAFKNHNTSKGRDSVMADVHYGYHGNGMDEIGAYVN